jgi:hypothetical protein
MPQMLKVIPFNELEEKFLRQVFGLVVVVTFAMDEGVQRRPICLAQSLQRFTGPGRVAVPGGNYDAPVRGREPFSPGPAERGVFLHGGIEVHVFGHIAGLYRTEA